ncbi:uncharacterized protein LOC117604773 isoform X1 [Osmia lignaria lignaria]|uniref:uncharacterized protein LOC117604773 isoform X1 n=1 Tax=Osmia lignaria lignaria TaxID=1437193 RepID=UPI00402B49EC
MKLGDNMTMEAYNIWGDVPPRKCRPPKIGDIPKHSAIDEESPGCISKSLTAPADSRDLNLSLDTSGNIVFPLDSGTSAEQLAQLRKIEGKSKSSKEALRFRYSTVAESQPLNLPIKTRDSKYFVQEDLTRKSPSPKDQEPDRPIDFEGKASIKLPVVKESTLLKFDNREDSTRIPSSPEDNSDQEIVEVRKDSALFLEEAEGLPALREILRARAPRIIRPRRESSGYASNLGTFDEDRRNSSSVDVLQDLSSFLKERRRSSAGPKRLNSRVIIGRAEESLTEEVVDCERMPTTEIHRKASGAGLEMPNIEEAKEIPRDEVHSRQESSDNLYGLNDLTEDVSISRHQDVSSSIFDVSSLSQSISRLSTSPSRTASNQQVHRLLSSSLSSSKLSDKPDQSIDRSKVIGTDIEDESIREPPTHRTKEKSIQKQDLQLSVLPRSIKMYRLMSTQSEDRIDGQLQLDRRISFQMSKQNDVTASSKDPRDLSSRSPNRSTNVSMLKSSVSSDIQALASTEVGEDSSIRTVCSSGEVGTSQRYLGDTSNVTVRPIYPYCPYSPYGSPQGSPRNRRRPLRESRRVSIDNRQGALQLNQYKLLDNIGQGSYGIVKLAYNEEDDTHYAMKILSKKKLMKKAGIFGRMAPGRKGAANPLAKVYREIALLKKLDHPNVVKLVEVLDDPDEDNLYLVFELVQRGEILQIPTDKPLDEETARKKFRDVVMGVEYRKSLSMVRRPRVELSLKFSFLFTVHYQRIVHRDIKPSNLLVDSDGRIKIADLGVSAELRASGELLSGPAGTPAFAAPETTTPGAHYSGTPCDIWSMGATLYSLVTGRVPWDGAGSIIGVQAAVRTEPLKFPEKPVLSKNLRELISKMLDKDPENRISLSEVKEHPWLTNDGAEPLPSEADNCRLPVTVTDEEVERVVTRIPKLDTLILIKTMLKQHSFQNPFLSKKSGKTACVDTPTDSIELSPSGRTDENVASRERIRNSKTERFHRTGRSNSAPDSYDWQTNGRQISIDTPLPPVTEASHQEAEIEKR